MQRFLLSWLGAWPAPGLLRVAPSARRMLPGPDGLVRPLVGVVSPRGVVVSVSPLAFGDVRRAVSAASRTRADLPSLLADVPAAVGLTGSPVEVRDLWWTASPLAPRPVAARGDAGATTLEHSAWGAEVVTAPDLAVRPRAEALALAADDVVARGAVALFTAPTGDAAAAETARAAGLRAAPWQLLRLTAPTGREGR